eukprot:10035413-Alexandrium_andersonii.AAC.1
MSHEQRWHRPRREHLRLVRACLPGPTRPDLPARTRPGPTCPRALPALRAARPLLPANCARSNGALGCYIAAPGCRGIFYTSGEGSTSGSGRMPR